MNEENLKIPSTAERQLIVAPKADPTSTRWDDVHGPNAEHLWGPI